jgi:uncharacterized protein (DUF58 family)
MTVSLRIVLILLAISLVAGAATGNRIYYRLVYLWAFLLIFSWTWSYFSVRGIRIKRLARTLRAQVGQVFEERFEVQNKSRIPRLWIEIRDESGLPNSEGSRVLTIVEPYQNRSYLARTRLMERGSFQLGPTVLASGDFFGLFPVEVEIPAEEMLLVYPLIVDIQNFPNPPGLLPGGEALRRRTQQVTPNAAGVREYINGDPLNRIHWLSSARRNALMVKEFELDPLADVWIFVDAQADVQSAQQPEIIRKGEPIQVLWQREIKIKLPPSTGEFAVSAAASLARYYLRRGRAVGLIAAGHFMNLLPPDRGGRQIGKILEALALLRMEGDIPLRGLVETQAKHIARGSTVVIITPSVSEDVIFVFDHLARRGLRPIAVLINSASFGGPTGTDILVEQVKSLGLPVRRVDSDLELSVALST